MPKFDKIDYKGIAGNIVSNLPTYEPENFRGSLDLRSSTLEEGVPAALINNESADAYLNELKAQRQSLLDKAANGTMQALNTAVVGTIGNTAGVIHGFANLANDQSFFDNPTFKFMDEWDEKVKEAMPLYRSQQEQTGSIADRVFDKDFVFGDLFQGAGFVASSLIPGIGWAKAGKSVRLGLLASKAGKLEKIIDPLNKTIHAINKTIPSATNLAAATFGRIYESRLESKGVYDEVYGKSYDKKLNELKGTLTDEEAVVQADQYATKQATDARNFTFGANMLLAIPDMIQMSKIFGNAVNKANTVNKITRNSITGLAEEATERTSKNLLGKILSNSKVQTALIEAGEEGTQYNIGETAKRIAEKDYDFDITNSINEFINQSIKNLSSPEFLTSALAGGIIGGGMSLLHNNKQDKNERQENTKTAIQNLNEYAPLLKKTQVAQDRINQYTQLEKQKTDVIQKIDNPETTEKEKIELKSLYRQLDNLQFSQAVQAHIEAGTLDSFLDEIDMFGNSTKDQLNSDFGIETFEYNEDGSEITPKEIAQKKIKRAKTLSAVYQSVQSNYSNLNQPTRNELFNITSALNYNDEKLDVVNNKITLLELEKNNAELTNKPFNPEKANTLRNLKEEKEYLVKTQESLGDRHEKLRTGKAENREVKSEVSTKPVETPTPTPDNILETVVSSTEGKYKGQEIEVLDNKGNRISFRVKGNKGSISLSREEYNKQVLGQTKADLKTPSQLTSTGEVVSEIKESKPTDEDFIIDNNEYEVGTDVILSTDKKFDPQVLPKDRKDLGTRSFFNSPLFFGNNGLTEKRNEILSDPNWKSKFRVVANKNYAKTKPKATKAYSNGRVDVYSNGGENALDLTIEYNDSATDKPNWVSYGSLPYGGMLRDKKGKPFDFSNMSFEDFINKFYVAKVTDSNGVEQTIEFTPNQFDLLKLQQGIFNEFETLVKQYYNNSSNEELELSENIVNTRLSYFVNSGENALNDLTTLAGFNNAKVLVISDGKINKELTNTESRLQVPEYLTDTYGTSNKTFLNIQLENGVNFWTIAYIKGNNKKVESEVVGDLTNLALNFNSREVSPESINEVEAIIKDLNSKVFIQNNLENYINFRAFPLDNNKGFKIKVQLKTDTGSEYIDIFNPETTVKKDGSKLNSKELEEYFNFDNLTKLINNGFKQFSVNINPNSFIANNTKGNPKLEDLTIPVKSIDYNIKFDYNIKELPTLKNNTTVDKSTTPSIDDDIEKEIAEQKAKIQKKTDFSRVLTSEVLPLKGNEDTYRRYNLLNKEGKIKSVDPNSESVKEWLKTNNNSPYYVFVIKQASDGKYKIFIKDKVLHSKLEDNSNSIGVQYLSDISSKIKDQYNLDVRLEPIFDNSGKPIKGKFENGVVYLNPQFATVDTPIHEVIHPFIELIKQNNNSLYKNLVSELKNSEIGKRVIETVNNNYDNLSQEELLDESLVTLMGYYSSGVISNQDKNLLEVLKAFFRKVALYIKNIFNKDLDPSTIASTATIGELSDIIVANKINLNAIEINNPKEAKLNLLSANESIKLINTIGAKTVQRITEKPTKQNLSSIIDSIIEQTKIKNNTRNIDASNIEDLDERKAYKLKRHLISESLTLPENIEAIKKSVTNDILKMHYIDEAKYSEEDDTVQNVNDEADIKDYEEGVENSGGWNNVSPEVRNFIYYNTFSYIDEAGYEVTEAVDGLQVYKQIQTALADQQAEDFLPILEGLAKYNVQLKSILDNFKIKTGLDSKGEKTLEQSNFYNKFFKAFENAKLEYIQVYKNKDGKFVVGSSNKTTTAGRLFNRWKNNTVVNKDTLKTSADKLQKTINSIGSEVLVNPTQIVNELYNGLSAIGLEVSKPYLEYSFIKESPLAVFENQGVTKLDLDTINKLLSTIKKGNDLFQKGTKGNTNILYEVAKADAVFRADGIEDTYRDSRGKLRNSYTKQNLVTKKIADWKNKIKDINFIKDIKEDKNNYYHYNYIFNNKLFTTEEQIQEVFRNADLALIGDIRLSNKDRDKFTTRNISSEAFSEMQLSFFRNTTSPKDIIDNSSFPFEARTNSRQQFAFVDFGKISDKNTELALRLPIDDRFSKDGRFTPWFTDQLYDTVFLQEYTKLKSYNNKGKLYYSKTEPLYVNDSILKEIKSGNAWSNLSIFNNSIIEEYVAKYDKPEYLELKDLLTVEDLSTKKELIKRYLNDSFTYSFQDYLDTLEKQDLIDDKSNITELGNMYANNFILRTSFQQLVKGDLSISKNNDDDIKRNGRVTAYGESGTDFNEGTNTSYKVLYLTDATKYKVKEDNNFRNATQEEIDDFNKSKSTLDIIKLDSDDAGARMTVKHLIDTLQRLGRLDSKTLGILNKVDSGEDITSYEASLIDLIPMKGVHAGVNTYLKMSQFTLTKQFTSIKDKDGSWIARRGREQLHNLRELMETNNIGLAIPKSGSKSISKPLFNQNKLLEGFEHDTFDNSEDVNWSDWRLQVENASGKIEISQPVQIIQMIDGSSKIDQSVKDKLQDLYVEQREGDLNDALNIANGDTEYGKQLLIDKFQDNAINSAADANTLEYLTGENNEFNYNKNLGHITFMFENYYTSHFNKNVLAQKVPGYKCTLAPATGINVLRDTKTGEIIQSDVYEKNKKDYNTKQYQDSELRIHSGISPYAECLMTKAQATKLGLSIGDSITEDVFKMIGTRLPCQGYSSMIPLKVVDFLPEYYGSTIIAPEEIVYIAGSDYDVDSLFIMRKEAYNDREGKLRYYTYNEKDNDLRWQDYKQYLTTGNKNIVSKLNESYRNIESKITTEDVLKSFGYPSTKEEFLAKEKELGKLLNSKYAVTNELVNIYEEILTNPVMLEELQKPVDNAELDVAGKTIYFDLLNQGSKINYFHNSDNALKKHFELATQGKRDVGSAANGNSVSSFFKKHKVALKDKYHFVFNNKAVTNVYEDNVIDFNFIYDSNGKPILNEEGIPLTSDIKEVAKQDVHSGLMSITVDNGKDPVCFMLNLDPANVSVASTMIHLGIGGKGFIATFMNSYSVKYNIQPSQFEKGLVPISVTKESLIKSMLGKATQEEEYGIALLYSRLKKITGTTSNISKLIATNKGIGSTFEDLDSITKAKQEINNQNLNVFANIDKAIKDNKNISFNLDAIETIDNQILSKEFLSRSSFIGNLKQFLSKTTLPDIQLDKEFSGYLVSNILKHNRNIDFKQASALCLPNNESSIVTKYFKLLSNPEFKNNVLIKFLTVERGNSVKPDLLYFNQSIKLNGKSLEKLTDGYRELIQSENEEISNFAKDMFYYLIVKDNMKFTINSFGRLLAPEMFKKLSGELKIAVEGIIEENDEKLKSITGKTFNELSNEFIQSYVRWIGNTDKFINYHHKKLKESGISIKRSKDDTKDGRILTLSFDVNNVGLDKDIIFDYYIEGDNTFIDYPDFIKSGTSIYHLKEQDGLNGRYEVTSYIGLPVMSPYHLDLETNEILFREKAKYLNVGTYSDNIENNNEPDIEIVMDFIDDSNAKSPEEFEDVEIETTNDLFGLVTEPSEVDYQNFPEPIDIEIPSESILEEVITTKPSETLQEAVDQNITQYVEDFYYSLDNEQKSKLANKGIPRLYSPSDIMKDYNKSKDQYNNNFDKYLEYLRNCRLV